MVASIELLETRTRIRQPNAAQAIGHARRHTWAVVANRHVEAVADPPADDVDATARLSVPDAMTNRVLD
jgi:hypothetical protein